jgi:tetratricopeptide (TPR) repeat protein
MSTESESEDVEQASEGSAGTGMPVWMYGVLAIVVLVPGVWIIFHAPSRNAATFSSGQVSERPNEAAMVQFRRYTNEGFAHYRNHEWNKAEAAFLEALKYSHGSASNALGLSNLGAVHNERGEFDVAIQLFEMALSMDPNLALARNNLAWARAQKAKPRQ